MEYEGHVIYARRQYTTIDITVLQICTVRPFPLCENSFTIQGKTDLVMDNSTSLRRAPASFPTFREFLHHQMKNEPWVCANLTIVGDIDDITHALGCGTVRAVSDGSCDYDKGIGTAGWCIIGGETALRGVTQVPHGSTNMDSMRSELGGLYSIVTVIEHIAQYYNVLAGKIEIGSDCDTALDATFMDTSKNPLNRINGDHIDLINAINIIRRRICNIIIKPLQCAYA